MITDHIFETDYAGLDPAKQTCTFIYAEGGVCGRNRSEHTRFLTGNKNASTTM